MQEQSAKIAMPGYEIIRKIGQGGMGTVFLAKQLSLNRDVAIKVLSKDIARDPVWVERFKREAQVAARLNHRNIVSVHEVGEMQGFNYYVMEYVEGDSLANIIEKKKTLTEEDALDITRQIAEALKHAHLHNIIHRDIKPENILIEKDRTAKLCDMGIAKQTSGELSKTLTVAGEVFGSPAYISPEYLDGKKLDIRSDIYSLGVTLYQMLTGAFPFEGETAVEIATKRLREDPPSAKKLNQSIRPSTNNLILKMMARDRDKRYLNPAELLADIAKVKGGGYIAPPPKPLNKKLLFAATIVLLPIISLAIYTSLTHNNLAELAEAEEHYNKAASFSNNLNYAGMIKELSEAIKLNPKNYLYYDERGFAMRMSSDFKGALEDYNKAISLNPTSFKPYFNRGVIKDDMGDFKGAIMDYDEAIKMNPTNVDAYLNRSTSKLNIGDSNGAVEDCTKGLAIDKNNEQLFHNRGKAKYNLHDYEGAIADYDQAIRIKPNYEIALLGRGSVKSDSGDYKGALSDYDACLRLEPNNVLALNNRGAVKIDLGDYEGALSDLTKALNINPNAKNLHYNLGLVKDKLGNYKDAIAEYDMAIRSEPKSAELYIFRGQSKVSDNRIKEAIDDYSKAIELNPNLAEAYRCRAYAKNRLGDNNGALADYKKAVELDKSLEKEILPIIDTLKAPNFSAVKELTEKNAKNAEFFYTAAQTCKNMGKYNEAIATYDHAITINPKYAEAYLGRGLAKAELGNYKEAIEDFTKVIELDPQNKDAYVEMGNAKFKLGTTQYIKEAISDWRKAIELEPLWKDWLENQINEALDKIIEK